MLNMMNYEIEDNEDDDFEGLEEEDEEMGDFSYGYDDDDYQSPDSDYEE